MVDAENNWKQCLRADGCIVADGTCANRCTPQMEEGIAKCEQDYQDQG